MLQQGEGAVEIIGSKTGEHNILTVPKVYLQHLIGSCTMRTTSLSCVQQQQNSRGTVINRMQQQYCVGRVHFMHAGATLLQLLQIHSSRLRA